MLTSLPEKTRRSRTQLTTVNHAALTAWLQAWTSGTSFSTPATVPVRQEKMIKSAFAVLRHARPKTANYANDRDTLSS